MTREPLVRNAAACSRALATAGDEDDVVFAHARQRRPRLVEREVEVRQPREHVADRDPGARAAFEHAEGDRRMAVDQANQLGGCIAAGADDVGGNQERPFESAAISSRVWAIEAATASGWVEPEVRLPRTERRGAMGASGA